MATRNDAATSTHRHLVIVVLLAFLSLLLVTAAALQTRLVAWRNNDNNDGSSVLAVVVVVLLTSSLASLVCVAAHLYVTYTVTHATLSRLHAHVQQQTRALHEQSQLLQTLLLQQQQQQQRDGATSEVHATASPPPHADSERCIVQHALLPCTTQRHDNDNTTSHDNDDDDGATVFCPRDDKDRAAVQTTHRSRYKILRHIGHGSFACVYLVEDKTTRRRYALKYMVCLDDHRRLAALRECETIHAVQGHPNVIRIVDMFMGYQFATHSSHASAAAAAATAATARAVAPAVTTSATLQTRPQWAHVMLRRDAQSQGHDTATSQQQQQPVLLPSQILSDTDTECLMRDARRLREQRRRHAHAAHDAAHTTTRLTAQTTAAAPTTTTRATRDDDDALAGKTACAQPSTAAPPHLPLQGASASVATTTATTTRASSVAAATSTLPHSTPRLSYAPGGGVRYTDFVDLSNNNNNNNNNNTTMQPCDATAAGIVCTTHAAAAATAVTATATATPVAAPHAATPHVVPTAHYRNFAPATDVTQTTSLYGGGGGYSRTVSVVDLTTTPPPELCKRDGKTHVSMHDDVDDNSNNDTTTTTSAAKAKTTTTAAVHVAARDAEPARVAAASSNTTQTSHTTHDSSTLVTSHTHSTTATATAAAAATTTARPSGYLCLVVEYHAMGDLSQYVQRLLSARGYTRNDDDNECDDDDDDDETRHNPLTEAQLLSIAYQLSSVLCHLHAQRPPIVHRDLKPENILIKGDPRQLYAQPLRATTTTTAAAAPASAASTDMSGSHTTTATTTTTSCARGAAEAATSATLCGRIRRRYIPIVVTDFGLAMTQEAHKRPGRGGGTRPYISPESWAGQTTTASDMWSLGCVLYALATGRLTERTVRVMAVEARQTTFAQTILNDLLQAHYSLLFGTFVLSLLVLDPSKRLTAAAATRCFRVGRARSDNNSDSATSADAATSEVHFDTSCPFFSNMLDL